MPKTESPQKEESQGTVSASPLPILPKDQGLSPEVISPSSSPNPQQEYVSKHTSKQQLPYHVLIVGITNPQSTSITTKLPSPRVHLERIQLPFNRSMEKNIMPTSINDCHDCHIALYMYLSSVCPGMHNEEDCTEEKSNGRPLIPEQQHQTIQQNCHSEQETVHSSPDSLAPLKRKIENHHTVSENGLTLCDTPSKKQKISNPCHDMPLSRSAKTTTVLVSSPPYQEPVEGQSSLSQPTHTSGTGSFLPLSQPCYSNVVSATSHVHRGVQEKRGSSLRSVPWKLEIPKPPTRMTRQPTAEESKAVSPSRVDTNDPSKTGSSTFHMPLIPQPLTSSPGQHTTQILSCPKKASSPLTEGDTKFQLEVNPSSPTQPACSKTTSTLNENTQCSLHGTQHPEEGHIPAVIDQSGPDSVLVDNFAVVFSEGEDDVEGSDSLISSQMNRQINKVHTFLKMDRLRRTKVSSITNSSI